MPVKDGPQWVHEHGDLVRDAQQLLRQSGGRMTGQRRLILEAFHSASEHPTAEEIFRIARRKDAHLNLSTVYRTLRWLEHEGLLRAQAFHEADRRDRFDSARPAAHYHFVCSTCEAVVEFDAAEMKVLQNRIERRYRLKIEQASLVFYGRCAKCAKDAGKNHKQDA